MVGLERIWNTILHTNIPKMQNTTKYNLTSDIQILNGFQFSFEKFFELLL